MAVTLVIGSQWGDEGKGKIIDFISTSSDVTLRFHGGNNAGHTVVNEYGKFPMHLIPSGIFAPKIKAYICNGVILDLEVLISEIEILTKAGIDLKDRLFISPRCHIIMPYHKILDKLYEEAKGKAKTGTTGRGIGPTYADKVSYNGIRLFDLLDKKHFSEKLSTQLAIKNKIISALSNKENLFPFRKHSSVKNKIIATFAEQQFNQKEIEDIFFGFRKKLLPYIKEPYPFIQKALSQNKSILIEGAHALFLDNDWGTYPYVTASNVVPGGLNAGAGIPPKYIDDVIGVVKAYTTRVGAGPFPTELFDDTGESLRKIGAEYGTTTGRPRRCGWFDAELVRFAGQICGFTGIAITKIDVLDTFKEIKICTGYLYKGKKVSYYEVNELLLAEIQPVYKTLKGWQQSLKGIKKYADLPPLAKKYIEEVEKQTNLKVTYISTGPQRNAIIVR